MDAAEAPAYTPLVPLLRARWIATLVVAAACGVFTLHHDALQMGAILTWAFAVGGVAGHYRAMRWFCQRPGGNDQPVRLASVGRVRSLRYPALALALVALRMATLGMRPTLGVVAVIAAAIAGFNLTACAHAIRWQCKTGHRLLAPMAPRPWIARSRLRGYLLDPVEPARIRRRSLLAPILIAVCIVSALDMHALDNRARADTTARVDVTHVDAALSDVSARLAGHPVSVTCWSTGGWRSFERRYRERVGGVTWHRRVFLAPYVCNWLEWMRAGHWASDQRDSYWMAESAGVLAHETGHVVLGSSEHDAECYALGHVAAALELLGVSTARAELLQSVYRERVHPSLPPAYTQPC
jgi:hypothetical protein